MPLPRSPGKVARTGGLNHGDTEIRRETGIRGNGPSATEAWDLRALISFGLRVLRASVVRYAGIWGNPDDIPRLLAAASGADLVLGSRYLDGIRVINWPLTRLMLSLGAALYVRLITGMPFTDPTGGFKCFRREALQTLALDSIQSNGYSFQIELTHRIWRRGLRVLEVPIIFTDRFHGQSKMSGHIVREALGMVWRLWAQHRFRRHPHPAG
jgi:hypothetical protein